MRIKGNELQKKGFFFLARVNRKASCFGTSFTEKCILSDREIATCFGIQFPGK